MNIKRLKHDCANHQTLCHGPVQRIWCIFLRRVQTLGQYGANDRANFFLLVYCVREGQNMKDGIFLHN